MPVRVTIVGSGTAAPEAGRVCSGYLLEHPDVRILLDCGPGVVHHMARFDLPWPRLDHLLITHFHNDHTGDIPMLLFALKHGVRPARTRPLTIWGPVGLAGRVEAMARAFGDHVSDPGFPLEVRELEPGQDVELGGVGVRVAKTPHTEESLCYRATSRGCSLGYTGDTGPSSDVADFMAGADVLIAECSLPDAERMETHLSSTSLADLALRAQPGLLVVTHVYPQLDRLGPLDRVREAGWTGGIRRAVDGEAVPVQPAP